MSPVQMTVIFVIVYLQLTKTQTSAAYVGVTETVCVIVAYTDIKKCN